MNTASRERFCRNGGGTFNHFCYDVYSSSMYKKLLITFTIGLIAGGVWWWFGLPDEEPWVVTNAPIVEAPLVEPPRAPVVAESVVPPVPPKPEVKSVQYKVPFTSQAPMGDWSQSAFQDGCEEASALMVWLARNGETLTAETARAKLLDMAAFQTKQIGHGVDTDAADTAKLLLGEYSGITDYDLAYDFDLVDLQLALQDGLVIVPTNGRALQNPNFTLPGPAQHMLVITGYDMRTREFITNDPGTRAGKGYRYPEQVLYDAIREYPTGKHLPITTSRQAMIIVPLAPQP